MNSNTEHPSARAYSGFVCLAGYLLTILLCIAVPMILLPPESRSAYFHVKIGWLVFLASAFWGSIAFFLLPLRRSSEDRLGVPRIAPGIAYVVAIYCISSAVLLLLQSLVTRWALANRVHLVIQLAIFVVASVLVLILGLPVFFAPKTRAPDKDGHQ